MNEKGKARPLVAQVTGQAKTAAYGGAAVPYEHFTLNPAARQFRVSDFLEQGRENAVPLRTLKTLLHLDGRTLRLLIQRERLQGAPILSSSAAGSGGYYLAVSPEEVACFASAMRRRAHEIERVASAVESGEIT